MNRTFAKSSRRSRGITLVEVVAGVALLGTLLVAVVMITGKLTSQSYLAGRRVEAYRAADALIAGWWNDIENLPKNDSGEIDGHDTWQWRTSTADAELKGIDAEIVTLEIVDTDKDGLSLARVEFLIKKPEEEDENDAKANEENAETQPAATGSDAG